MGAMSELLEEADLAAGTAVPTSMNRLSISSRPLDGHQGVCRLSGRFYHQRRSYRPRIADCWHRLCADPAGRLIGVASRSHSCAQTQYLLSRLLIRNAPPSGHP